jgi:hypothetical protein
MPWRRLGERRYSSYLFTTSALDGGEWSASRPGSAFTPGERTPGTHWTGGWADLRAGLDTEDRGTRPLVLNQKITTACSERVIVISNKKHIIKFFSRTR